MARVLDSAPPSLLHRAPRHRLLAAVLAAQLLVVACVGAGSGDRRAAVRGWTEIAAPAPGARVLVTLSIGDRMMMLGSVPHGRARAPAAWTSADARTWRRVPIRPATGYGWQAEFVMATAVGRRVTAFGQANGGAHGNPRPTLWVGTAAGLKEHEQPITMFGGEDAISQTDETARPGQDLIVGAWESRRHRYGAAVWTSPDGIRWTRDADDPALQSAPGEQTTARGAAASPRGFLVVGDTLAGEAQLPLAWSSADGTAWRRLVLPHGVAATAARAACDARGCVVVGNTTRGAPRLQCWTVPLGGTATGRGAGPGGGLTEPAQVLLQGDVAISVVGIDRIARLTVSRRDCVRTTRVAMPVAERDATVAAMPHRLVLATTDAGASRLWTRPLPGAP